MRIIARAALAMLAAAVLSSGSSRWIPLFDGKSLAGWHVAARPEDRAKSFWSVRDGAITCDSLGRKNHDYVWLVSDREFGDFALRLKVRSFRNSPGNSGVQVRSRYDAQQSWLDGPQVDIHPPGPWRTGLIYDETREMKRWIYPPLPDWNIQPSNGPRHWVWRQSDEGDGWNDIEIVCRGTRITTKVNGNPVADFDGSGILDNAAHRLHNVGLYGHIALQLHMQDELRIQYKDIAVLPLDLPASAPDLMPVPASVTLGRGSLEIDSSFRAALDSCSEPGLEAAAARMVERLSRLTGIPMDARLADAASATLVIHCGGPGEKVQSPREDESYTLEVTPRQARISAATPVGALRGMETFLQLAAPDEIGFSAPAVRIEDRPRFAWRGLLIDTARHFMPVKVIERNLDAMAAVKLNVLHWHLADDQGFRVESKRFPKLQEMGSDDLYYTQEEIRKVVAYARARGIRIVPEFDMPGHTTAWFVGYPELASAPGPYAIERNWGVFDPSMNPASEQVYQFIDEFIGEMAALFPDEYFHIGGDEVTGKQWNQNPAIQEFKRARGIASNEDLQTYFSKRVVAIVAAHGKKAVGWDEILNPALPQDAVIQSWRGSKSLAEAVRQGHRAILSSGYYLDLMRPAASHYGVDPLAGAAASLSDEEKSRILGGEACEWTELADAGNLDSRIWPRMAAIAERFWSPAQVTDTASMYRRLEVVSTRLEFLGLTHRSGRDRMIERMAGYRPVGPLLDLSTALEPVREYARRRLHRYTQLTPLNRMVDAAAPESTVARDFAGQVAALVGGDKSRREDIRKQLQLWRDQYPALKPLFDESSLVAELEPLSRDVAALSEAGLRALASLEHRRPLSRGWRAAQIRLLRQANTPRAELTIAILDPIERLVKAALVSRAR